MEPAPLRDDDAHHEALHRKAARERVAKALDALVAADDEACAERTRTLELLGHARLRDEVGLAGSPAAQGVFERGGCIEGEESETLALRRHEREPQLDEVVVDVGAEPADAVARRARELGREVLERAGLIPRCLVERDLELAQPGLG